jgi:hypothetical protein
MKTLPKVRLLWIVLVFPSLTLLPTSNAKAQLFQPRNDWVRRRALADLRGQSYSDEGPGGRGYYTPMYLPGFDDTNGPSRAYMPIFNAPQAIPNEGALRRSQDESVSRPAAGGFIARQGLFRRVFRRR